MSFTATISLPLTSVASLSSILELYRNSSASELEKLHKEITSQIKKFNQQVEIIKIQKEIEEKGYSINQTYYNVPNIQTLTLPYQVKILSREKDNLDKADICCSSYDNRWADLLNYQPREDLIDSKELSIENTPWEYGDMDYPCWQNKGTLNIYIYHNQKFPKKNCTMTILFYYGDVDIVNVTLKDGFIISETGTRDDGTVYINNYPTCGEGTLKPFEYDESGLFIVPASIKDLH